MKKYKLGPKETFGRGGTYITARRITALIDIPAHNVKAGDLGGWVASRWALSHDGDCWIGENSLVFSGCRVQDDALVTGNATLSGSCKVSENAIVKDYAWIAGPVIIRDHAIISDHVNIDSDDYTYAENYAYATESKGYEITDHAQVSGSPKISGSGYIKGSAQITGTPKIAFVKMSGTSVISGSPEIRDCILENSAQIFDSAVVWRTKMTGKTKIYGTSHISTSAYYTRLADRAKVFGNARISGSPNNNATVLSGDVSVYDNAIVREGCQISGKTVVNESAHLLEYCNISGDSTVSGPSPLPSGYKASDITQDKDGIRVGRNKITDPFSLISSGTSGKPFNANYIGAYGDTAISAALRKRTVTPVTSSKKAEPVKPASKSIEPIRRELAEIVANVEKDYDAYKNDVVKLIKYPTMVDLKDELTLEFTFALRKAKRELDYGQNVAKMEESVEKLERAFLAAEANAQKIGPSNYTEQEVKKTETAKQMIAMALDEDASENERRVSFKQAFKILEGVIAVPDSAVESMKIQVGLKELEA